MPRKVFTAGEILTAADVNTNLMDQAVMVFDDSAARGSAIPSPSEGMVTYLKDTDSVELYTTAWGAFGGKILQVAETVKTDTFITTSSSYVAVTGLSVSITPSSTTSKILVIAQVATGTGAQFQLGFGHYKITRGGTDIYVGDASGSRVRSVYGGRAEANTAGRIDSHSVVFLDSPSTTSSTSYRVEARQANDGSAQINRSYDDTDNAQHGRGASSITVMEVAG